MAAVASSSTASLNNGVVSSNVTSNELSESERSEMVKTLDLTYPARVGWLLKKSRYIKQWRKRMDVDAVFWYC